MCKFTSIYKRVAAATGLILSMINSDSLSWKSEFLWQANDFSDVTLACKDCSQSEPSVSVWQLPTLWMWLWSMWIPLSSLAGRKRWSKGSSALSCWSTARGKSSPPSSAALIYNLLKLGVSVIMHLQLKLRRRGGRRRKRRRTREERRGSLNLSLPTTSAWWWRRGCLQADSCWSKLLKNNLHPLQRSLRSLRSWGTASWTSLWTPLLQLRKGKRYPLSILTMRSPTSRKRKWRE